MTETRTAPPLTAGEELALREAIGREDSLDCSWCDAELVAESTGRLLATLDQARAAWPLRSTY